MGFDVVPLGPHTWDGQLGRHAWIVRPHLERRHLEHHHLGRRA